MTDLGAVIQVIAFDIFGTTVDWHTGVTEQVAAEARRQGVDLDAARFADDWRGRYLPSMERVNTGAAEWAHLDALHRKSLDELLAERGVAAAFDDAARRRLVHAWHRLPNWDDAAAGLARLRDRYVAAALSNGGFALLTHLVKAAALPFDCILSAELAHAYKPAPEPYLTTARLLDVRPDQVLMVACHRWDLDGARGAGLRTAFVERPGEKGPHRTADRAEEVTADLHATSFTDLADRLGC
ncbi:2-haloacid dehalogenase [Amycolatopsis arida]|uniref:2-haloacid dehalogenase n=1 Tax=Amycolatopsis arida TaxID=587909 RepID=A0A1I5QEI6_9PSEU|nr:haloacid dehalogenase type II [Amycolatopsis arida]TDX98812.1 2-haloacid dehalogenase [Amycolatopsis arida]SFP44724.1 2-haloacid dehalogenase [Amycolatopsis arida]